MYNISNFPPSKSFLNEINNTVLIKEIALDQSEHMVNSVLYFTRSSNYRYNGQESNNKENSIIPYLLLGTEKGRLVELNLKTEQIESQLKVISQPILYIKYNKYSNYLVVITEDQVILNVKINDISATPIEDSLIQNAFPAYCEEILDIKTTSDANFLFSSNDLGLKYYDNNTKLSKIYEGHKDFILHIDYKEGFVSTASKDGTLRIWKEYYDIYDIENNDSSNMKFKLTSSFKCIFVLKGHLEAVNTSCLMLRNNSVMVCSAGKDKSIKMWDLTNYYKKLQTQITLRENELKNNDNYDEVVSYLEQLSLFKQAKASIVNTSVFTEIAHDEEISFVKVSHNEKLLASGSTDKTCKIWRIISTRHNKKLMNEDISHETKLEILFELKGHTRAISDVSFSKVAKICATASTDKTIRIWDLKNGKCLSTLTGHLAAVIRVEWVYLGTHILSTGGDGLIKLWNLKTSENVVTLSAHEGKIWGLALQKPPKPVVFKSNKININEINEDIEEADSISNIISNIKVSSFTDNFSINNFITQENHNSNKTISPYIDGECLQLNFLTGGSDSLITYWNDVTANKEIEVLKEKELKMMKEEQLRYISSSKSYVEAMKLSLELSHKRDFLTNFISYINKHVKTNVDSKIIVNEDNNRSKIALNSNDPISVVIKNRLVLEQIDLNSENIKDINNNSSIDYNIVVEELKEIVLNNYAVILEVVRDNNIKASNYYYAQVLLKVVLKAIPSSMFLGKSKLRGSRKLRNKDSNNKNANGSGSALDHLNKEFERLTKTNEDENKADVSKYAKIDFVENFAIVKSYTEKHIERLNREITMTYLLDSIMDNLFLFPEN